MSTPSAPLNPSSSAPSAPLATQSSSSVRPAPANSLPLSSARPAPSNSQPSIARPVPSNASSTRPVPPNQPSTLSARPAPSNPASSSNVRPVSANPQPSSNPRPAPSNTPSSSSSRPAPAPQSSSSTPRFTPNPQYYVPAEPSRRLPPLDSYLQSVPESAIDPQISAWVFQPPPPPPPKEPQSQRLPPLESYVDAVPESALDTQLSTWVFQAPPATNPSNDGSPDEEPTDEGRVCEPIPELVFKLGCDTHDALRAAVNAATIHLGQYYVYHRTAPNEGRAQLVCWRGKTHTRRAKNTHKVDCPVGLVVRCRADGKWTVVRPTSTSGHNHLCDRASEIVPYIGDLCRKHEDFIARQRTRGVPPAAVMQDLYDLFGAYIPKKALYNTYARIERDGIRLGTSESAGPSLALSGSAPPPYARKTTQATTASLRGAQEVHCERCLESGHLAKDCLAPAPVRRCERCQELGHAAKDCMAPAPVPAIATPVRRAREMRSRPTCHACGRMGCRTGSPRCPKAPSGGVAAQSGTVAPPSGTAAPQDGA